jgi:putative heme-binding domain-containing protein
MTSSRPPYISACALVRFCGLIAYPILFLGNTCVQAQAQQPNATTGRQANQSVEQLAGNAEVAEILRTRPGRGVMSDGSQPTAPDKAIQSFRVREGLSIELVAAEPKISQPLFLSWDSRGRMWVVQYRQYQYPAGLKVVRFDQHLRAVFDKTPAAPPNHVPGADVISMLEDTDGDGTYDKQQDVITGLNIATSVAIGRSGIWVMNPPYLLCYPDLDQDGWPDADPQVHLSGFGIQDTHSVANSLMFGPDGWLYGANGSTTGGTIVSAATPSTHFEGQCIWRYHPERREFEIYAEGGGNTFSLDIDAQGRVFSGTNGGGTRGWYYPQGSYSQKNWGKHGPLTNPFAFGFFNAMRFSGDDRRFPQAFMVYDGGLLPQEFSGSIIAPNSMHNLVWHSRRYPDGSTFRTEDLPNLIDSSDRWFRPVYAGTGPDGGVYLADWYDTRLSHVSPIDDWHKESGRIYRVAPIADASSDQSGSQIAQPPGAKQKLLSKIDLTTCTTQQLVELLGHSNKWTRQRAALELGWRGDKSCLPALEDLIQRGSVLDAVWALNNLDELTPQRASKLLSHPDAHVRRCVVRLLGDRHQSIAEFAALAKRDVDVEVRSQLAATAKRIPTRDAHELLAGLLERDEDMADLHLPLMIWWAIEAHANDFPATLEFLSRPEIWRSQILRQIVAERIVQRYAAGGTLQGIEQANQLLSLPLDAKVREAMIIGLNKAFLGRTLPPNLPSSIQQALQAYRQARGTDGIVLAARQGEEKATQQVLDWLKSSQTEPSLRLEAAQVFGQRKDPAALNTLLALATGGAGADPALQRVALQSLAIYDHEPIATHLTNAFDSSISAEHSLRETACRTLASRKNWATVLLREVNAWRINKRDLPADVIVQLRLYDDPNLQAEVEKAFGKVESISSPEQAEQIRQLAAELEPVVKSVSRSPVSADHQQLLAAGEMIFADRCGKCHQLFGKGESVGPKLDSYDRTNLQFWLTAIIAPNIEIREGYQLYQVVTVDGRVLTGLIAGEDLNSTSLRTADGQLVTLSKDSIEHLQAMKSSLMPEGLLQELRPTQIQQLFVYLASQPGARPTTAQ